MICPRLAVALATSAAALALADVATASAQTGTVTQPVASNQPIALPARLGGYEDLVAAMKADGEKASAVASLRANEAHVTSETVAAYQQAYGGAAVAYHAYASAGETRLPYVIAVRAPSPGMVVGPVLSAKYLGFAKPLKQVIDTGAVQCEVDWNPPTNAGHRPKPSTELIVGCQRTGNDLTVFTGLDGFKGPKGLARAVAFTNAAYTAAAG